jgi:phage-related protein
MAGALKAGGVYVAVSAAIGEFAKAMGDVVRTVEQTAKKVKESAQAVANVGTLFAAGMGGAVLAAAESNAAMRADLEKLKSYLYTLAADLGDAFGPFLRELTTTVGSVVGAFQRLSPEVKASVARLVVLVAATGAVAGVVSRGAGLMEGLAKAAGAVLVPALNAASVATKALGKAGGAVFPKLGKDVAAMEAGMVKSLARMALGFGAVLLPVLAVAAAVTALALLAGALYEAWNDSSTGMKDAVLSAWERLKGLGKRLAEALASWWESLKGFVLAGLRLVLEAVAGKVRAIGKAVAPLARGLGLDGIASTYEDMQQLTGDKLLSSLQEGATFLADKASEAAGAVAGAARKVADSVGKGFAYAGKGLGRAWADSGIEERLKQLKGLFQGVVGGRGPEMRRPEETPEELAAAGGSARTVGRMGMPGGFAAIRNELATGWGLMAQAARTRYLAAMKETRALAEAIYQSVTAARTAIVSRFISRLESSLMGLAEAAQQGFTAGGPQGAVAAVGVELLMRSQAFQELMSIVAAIVQKVADALGAIITPLQEWYAALFLVVDAVLQALVPVLQQFGQVVEPLVPIVVLVAEVLSALGPVLTLLMQVLNPLMVAFELLAGPALKGLFDVVKFLARVVLTIVKAIGDVWNGILEAIQSVFRSLAKISVLGAKPLGFLNGWADGLEGAMVDTDALANSLRRLNGLTYEAAQERARETAAVLRNREAVAKATESLTNVPNAWKVALARFEAQDAQQGPGATPTVPVPTSPSMPAGNGATWTPSTPGNRPPPPGAGAGGGDLLAPARGALVNTVNISAFSPTEAMERFTGFFDRMQFRATGTRGVAGRYALPEAP